MAVLNSTLNQYDLFYVFDYKDGVLFRKNNKKQKNGGKDKEGYSTIGLNGKNYFMHRLIYLFFHGYLPEIVDHIDGNKSNNRIENLRPANSSTNGYNSKLSKKNTSGYKGVAWHQTSRKWKATINVNKKHIYLGTYNSAEEANKIVETYRKEHHQEFARHK